MTISWLEVATWGTCSSAHPTADHFGREYAQLAVRCWWPPREGSSAVAILDAGPVHCVDHGRHFRDPAYRLLPKLEALACHTPGNGSIR